MKALLMHPDRDFDLERELPRHERSLTQDLELGTLLRAMAGNDEFLLDIARKSLLSGLRNDVDTILYRQEILKDCLTNPAPVRELYALAVEAIEKRRKIYFGFLSHYPSTVLSGSLDALQMFMGVLRKVRGLADASASRMRSKGFTTLFAMLQKEFSDEYFATVQDHMTQLKFRKGVLQSAELGAGNEGTRHVLRQARDKRPNWLKRILGQGQPTYTFRLHERDEAGARILSELRDRGINAVANALAQSTDHILSFFEMVRAEVAFYVGCLNLREKIAPYGAPVCFPRPEPVAARRLRFTGLYDVCLALSMARGVVGNSLDADDRSLAIITGANQGGKSSFLRSVGLAQLMMQCGMFVAAETFAAELCMSLFTHYKREEDPTMKKGKLDEELARMSDIAESIAPDSLVLLNESFASTNEREGSEIARQIVSALLEKRVKVFFVTHLYDFAHRFFESNRQDAIFLRAERLADGTRTFRLIEGEPLETSYGEDLYREIFSAETAESSAR